MADVIDAIIAEALGEGPAGMAAVAHVINTRALQTGKTPQQVISEAGQFSGVSNPGSSVAQSMKDPAVRAQVEQIWNGVTSGQIPNPYPGADYFHTPQVNPSWSRSYDRVGQTGNHIFYSSGKPVPEQAPRTAPTPRAPITRPSQSTNVASNGLEYDASGALVGYDRFGFPLPGYTPPNARGTTRTAPTPADPIMRPAQMASNTALGAIEGASPSEFDWSKYATGGAAGRPDSFTGLSGPFSQALQEMLLAAPPEVQIGISSAYRSPELQAKLWEDALAKYGSPEAARKWVAPPGNSQHNHGNAGDLKFTTPAAREWAHANAGKYGLAFPLSNEPWHIELGTARGGPALAYAGGPTPAMRPGAAPKKSGGIMGGIGGGLSNLLGYAGQQAAPIMRSAQRAGQAAAPSIMQAALGTVAGRTALIEPGLKQAFTGSPSGMAPTQAVQAQIMRGAPSSDAAYHMANNAAVERAIAGARDPAAARRLNSR